MGKAWEWRVASRALATRDVACGNAGSRLLKTRSTLSAEHQGPMALLSSAPKSRSRHLQVVNLQAVRPRESKLMGGGGWQRPAEQL